MVSRLLLQQVDPPHTRQATGTPPVLPATKKHSSLKLTLDVHKHQIQPKHTLPCAKGTQARLQTFT
eukprot:1697185-Amphidinium_carterae.1